MKSILFFVLTLLLCSCKKEKPETVTIRGMTFGCQVNGKNFIPDKWDYGLNIPPMHIDFWFDPLTKTTYLKILAEKQNSFVEIYLNSPLTSGRRDLKFTTIPFPTNVNPKDYGLYNSDAEYITNDSIGGYVNLIEIDTLTNKVYGTFEFTGTDRNTGKQVKVTNGVFKNY